MHDRRGAPLRPLALASTLLLLALLLALPVPAQDAAPGPDGALFSALLVARSQFDAGEPIKVEISLANRTSEWIEIAQGAELASRMSLRTEGRVDEPQKPGRVGSARATSLGPGGFLGVTFDARELFPALGKPGRYALVFSPEGAAERRVEIDVLPAFEASADYWLELEGPSGKLAIDLDEKGAPTAVRQVLRLAWLGLLDGAVVPRLQKGYAMRITPPTRDGAVTIPFEATKSQLLAGSVILEPTMVGGARVNTSNLIVLLAPQTTEPGSATAIGHVAKGRDVLDKLAASPTTGADGSPPWSPRSPIRFESVEVVKR